MAKHLCDDFSLSGLVYHVLYILSTRQLCASVHTFFKDTEILFSSLSI